MKFNNSSWFPLNNFSPSKGCHFDWMIGVEKFKGVKDNITGATVKPLETILWNRTMNFLTVKLETYLKARDDPGMHDKLKSLGLPLDLKI